MSTQPGPNPFPCGGKNQPACPPIDTLGTYTPEQMQAHGHLNYHKGSADTLAKVNAVLDDPGPAWGDGELARAIRKALA